jgi:hypothetical protein
MERSNDGYHLILKNEKFIKMRQKAIFFNKMKLP